MTAYVTLMRRWGNLDGHTYICGVYATADSACRAGTIEKSRRSDKYEWEVWKVEHQNKTLVKESVAREKAKSPEGK